MARTSKVKYGTYLAVIPRYRKACYNVIDETLGSEITHWSGNRWLDETITTAVETPNLVETKNYPLLKRKVFWQGGHLRDAIAAENLIINLNPRDLSAWYLLAARKIMKRRTIAWGHLFPRAGHNSPTARVRRVMRRLADGTILYDYASLEHAKREVPGQPVWVAPNAIYRKSELQPIPPADTRNRILYVGRLVEVKAIDRLLYGFARSGLSEQGAVLTIVGNGPQKEALQQLARDLGIEQSTEFIPGVYDAAALRKLYAETVCSVSPGYAGLSITQSLGFGVPIVVSENELHAPEIELDSTGGVLYYDSSTENGLAGALVKVYQNPDQVDGEALRAYVHDTYSAEEMAGGVINALRGESPQ
ncbi:glycosyltransferase family 4 protein [Hoyosella rhizosphaerae]|uniref:Glycosyl transferase family 1 domain-containing protein n=1 Tax=Hoyosella rhizosphaerae TaxID=1755582 RepID=A0A916XE30_9ACTN|nr:glycosyltransferase family 4 protein [Hoyosella rhizosphaerae]MBN4925891.1 glycosyltransferase family 4 protein [Hoyosella rhizosphaerae]GGC67145.1 hypothetical protein GCM10011410_19770 [Hoyosella rhizosphaerae]